MNVQKITTDDLRRMKDKEGLILQGCGGDLQEWMDGINDYHRVGNITDVHDPNDPTDDEITGTYTVSIPAYIEAAAQNQIPAEQEVSVFDILLPYGTKLLVSVEFENHLSLLNHESVTVEYHMLANGNRITAGDDG